MSGSGESNIVPLSWGGTLQHVSLPTRFMCPPNCVGAPQNLSCYIPEVSHSGTFVGFVPMGPRPINPNSSTQSVPRPSFVSSATPCVLGSNLGGNIEAQGQASPLGNAFCRSRQRSDSFDSATERFLKMAKRYGLTVGIKDDDETPKDKDSKDVEPLETKPGGPDLVGTVEKEDLSFNDSFSVQKITVDKGEQLTQSNVKDNEESVDLKINPTAGNESSEFDLQYSLDVKAEPYFPSKSSSCTELSSISEIEKPVASDVIICSEEAPSITNGAETVLPTSSHEHPALPAMALKEMANAQIQTDNTLRERALMETVDAQVQTVDMLRARASEETVDAQVQTSDTVRARTLEETVDAQVQTVDTLRASAVDAQVQINITDFTKGKDSCSESQQETIGSGQLRSSQKSKKYGPETNYTYAVRLAALVKRNSPAMIQRPEEFSSLLLKKLTAFRNRFHLDGDSQVDSVTCQLAVQLLVDKPELAEWKKGNEYFRSLLAEMTNFLEKGYSVILDAYQNHIAALNKLADINKDQENNPVAESTEAANRIMGHNKTPVSTVSTTNSFASVGSHLSSPGSFSSIPSPLPSSPEVSPSIGEELDGIKDLSSSNEDFERADLVACFEKLKETFVPKYLSALPKKRAAALPMPELDHNSVNAVEQGLQTAQIQPAAVISINSLFQQPNAAKGLVTSATNDSVKIETNSITSFQDCSRDENFHFDQAVTALRQPTLDISHYKSLPKSCETQDGTVSQHDGSVKNYPLVSKVLKITKPLDIRRKKKAAQPSTVPAHTGLAAPSLDISGSKEDDMYRWKIKSGQLTVGEDDSCDGSVKSASLYKSRQKKLAKLTDLVDEELSCAETESVKSASVYKRSNKLVQPIYLTPAQRKKNYLMGDSDKGKTPCKAQEEELTEVNRFHTTKTCQRLCAGDSNPSYAPSLSPSSFSYAASVSTAWSNLLSDALSAMTAVTPSHVNYNYDSSLSGSESVNAPKHSKRYNSILDEIDYASNGATFKYESSGAEKTIDGPEETSHLSSHNQKSRRYDCLDEIKVSDPPTSGKEDGKGLSTLPNLEGTWFKVRKLSGQKEVKSMEEKLIDFRLQEKYSNLMKLIQESYPFLTRVESMTALELVFETCDELKGMRQQRILAEVNAAIQCLYPEKLKHMETS